MSPGDVRLDHLRGLVLGWLLAQHRGVPFTVPGPEPGLDWLGVPYTQGEAFPVELGPFPTEATLGDLRGFVREAVLCLLAQAGWRRHPEDGWENLTRGELLIRFRPEGLLTRTVEFEPQVWREINRQRLQELAPSELLAEVRPYLKGSQKPERQLEAEALMCCEEVDDLEALAERLT